MMKFKCTTCGAQPERANLWIARMVEIREYYGGLVAESEEFTLGDDDIDRKRLLCPECGGKIKVVDEPCQHAWGETKFGYDDHEGKVMRQCNFCGIEQIGVARAVWPDA